MDSFPATILASMLDKSPIVQGACFVLSDLETFSKHPTQNGLRHPLL